MDDLDGLDWSASSKPTSNKAPFASSGNYYTSLQPVPGLVQVPVPASSGRSTPSVQRSPTPKATGGGNANPSAADSFSNLLSFGSARQGNTLTLQEQQQRLEAEKAKKVAEQKRQYELQFGHTQFWDGLGANPQSLLSTTSPTANPLLSSVGVSKSAANSTANITGDSEDLFAAFNADTKVDNSSYYPPPTAPAHDDVKEPSSQPVDLSKAEAWKQPSQGSIRGEFGDDDDPFGLGRIRTHKAPSDTHVATADDEDFLGDLGKPVEQVKRQNKAQPVAQEQLNSQNDSLDRDDPWHKAVGELVDMGFSAENSRRSLTESGAGLDVQVAVGWLLNDAHRQAKAKAQRKAGQGSFPGREVASDTNGAGRDASADRRALEALPPWMRDEGRNQSGPKREESRSPANSDGDVSKTAAAVGTNLLKTANTLWKSSQKKVQRAVSEFSQESDPSQPKWMRDMSSERRPRERHAFPEDGQRDRIASASEASPTVTDEALLLEADSRPPLRKTKPASDPRFLSSSSTSSRDQSPAASNPSTGRSTPTPRWQQNAPMPANDLRSRLSKQALEEQPAQAYVSPARRRRAAPSSTVADEPSLLFSDAETTKPQPYPRPQVLPSTATSQRICTPQTSKPPTPIPMRPKVSPRSTPDLSPAALANSTQHRLAGTAHFKRGDYASAHTSYTSSLNALAQGHPIRVLLLCNRSLTALKIGDPKSAVSDADAALDLIGPARGESESIDLGHGKEDGMKDMRELYDKALVRKAEALEQMERWKEAGAIWQEAVETGAGGAVAIQGRERCEKALRPKPKPNNARPQPQRPTVKLRSTAGDLAPTSAEGAAAVNRLRAANLAAEKADDEKFALSDGVDARISKWRDGRKDNIRALLGGMDQVLWEASGWKKVGMHELVMNNKVKIVYMKAIARVHPDKLPQDATTEIKMISASVFATLNEAWDKFKTENGM